MNIEYSKEHFLNLPTSMHRLSRISDDLGIEIYLKRDDLSGIGMGGNKLRKLEYFIHDALKKKATMLVTTGGAQTNHGRQTAAIAARYGMKCCIVTADPYPGQVNANILLDTIFGSDIVFAPGRPLKETIKDTIKKYEEDGEAVYYVPMGGSNELGCAGYIECADELKADCRNLPNVNVFVTAGSLGTYMGLYLGLDGSDISLTGVLIAPYENDVREYALDYYTRCTRFFNLPQRDRRKEDFHILEDYTYGAYNNEVKEVRDAIRYMGSMEGIVLDPCYTGKTFNAILTEIDNGRITASDTVVMIHTGGMPGLYTEHHRVHFEEEAMEHIILL